MLSPSVLPPLTIICSPCHICSFFRCSQIPPECDEFHRRFGEGFEPLGNMVDDLVRRGHPVRSGKWDGPKLAIELRTGRRQSDKEWKSSPNIGLLFWHLGLGKRIFDHSGNASQCQVSRAPGISFTCKQSQQNPHRRSLVMTRNEWANATNDGSEFVPCNADVDRDAPERDAEKDHCDDDLENNNFVTRRQGVLGLSRHF
ncbi:hypothetical protein C8R45DRAFT_1000464 [Mycena sanguinolenta]|nr:hypothetical protein C8R45DRAFT_1000464 [Mycena sanguinolenta]